MSSSTLAARRRLISLEARSSRALRHIKCDRRDGEAICSPLRFAAIQYLSEAGRVGVGVKPACQSGIDRVALAESATCLAERPA